MRSSARCPRSQTRHPKLSRGLVGFKHRGSDRFGLLTRNEVTAAVDNAACDKLREIHAFLGRRFRRSGSKARSSTMQDHRRDFDLRALSQLTFHLLETRFTRRIEVAVAIRM